MTYDEWFRSLNENGRETYFLGQEGKISKEAWDFQQAKIDEHGKRIIDALILARNPQLGAVLAEGCRGSGIDLIIKALEGGDDGHN